MNSDDGELIRYAAKAKVLRLFLDYDGTLADFAPSPDTLLPDLELIDLMKRLVNSKGILPAIISGRKMEHVAKLLPVKGLLLAGTYGIEMQLPDGQYWSAIDINRIRPIIEHTIPLWKKLIENRNDFYLEDKGWSIAIHGRLADEAEAQEVMWSAHQMIRDLPPDPLFRLYEGERFMEYAPVLASKILAAQWIVDNLTPKEALIVIIGDDDKDEEAFCVALKSGGFAIRISASPCQTQAQLCLKNPSSTRAWLKELISKRED